MTLVRVAERIEVNQGSLSRIENGERGTSPLLAEHSWTAVASMTRTRIAHMMENLHP